MRKLQEIEFNVFTSQIVDIIIPELQFVSSKTINLEEDSKDYDSNGLKGLKTVNGKTQEEKTKDSHF